MASTLDTDSTEKLCRYCLDGKNAIDLISPCDCQGTSKYVHQECLAQWIKTKHASSLRINILQHDSITRTLQCTECRGNYQIRISPVSWNTFFYRLLFDGSNQKLLQKMCLQIAWILFQSTTLSLVSKAFIKSVNEFHRINNVGAVQNMHGFSKLFQQLITRTVECNISLLHSMKANIRLFFYYLIHPILWVKQMVLTVINSVKNKLMTTWEYITHPMKIVRCILHSITRFILFIRVAFLFLLIIQHTASITFNASKLYQAFKKHKLNLVRLQILGKTED